MGTRIHTKLPMSLYMGLVGIYSPRRKLFQVVGFIQDRQPPFGFRRAYPETTLVECHGVFHFAKNVLLGVPNLEGLVLIDKLIVDPKVGHAVDVSTTDLDGDGVDACAVVFDFIYIELTSWTLVLIDYEYEIFIRISSVCIRY